MAEASNDALKIKREIEKTRIEMSETLGEIQDRLRPDHLLQQAKDGVKEAAAGKARSIMNSAGETAGAVAYRAKGAGEHLAWYAKEHPIRIAVTIGALTWFALRSRNRAGAWEGVAETSWDDMEPVLFDEGRSLRTRVGDYAASARDTVGAYASSARDTVGEYASTARDTVGELASSARSTAGEYAESARAGARRASERVRGAASSATSTTTDWVQENPLAAGAIALAVGAAIAMALPGTEVEDRAMGETRDRAWQRANQAAAELKKNVTRKVEDAAENFAVDSLLGPDGSTAEPMGRA